MDYEVYFPRGIAVGDAFCNRESERKRLIANILSGQHTLIMSPRRYGKTSLVKFAAVESGILFAESDLFVAVDAKRIEQQILSAVKKIISEVRAPIEHVLDILRQYFLKNNAQWTVGTQGVNIALIPKKDNDPASTILEALQALDNLLAKKNIKAVLFLDEMQEISEIAEGKGIEGALRNVAQQTKHLSFVFSGSSRHLLSKMFYDKARPLFKLCDRILLERIDEPHYHLHINKFAKKAWARTLDDNALDAIFSLTERHPFYINGLCRRIFEHNRSQPPSSDMIQTYWISMVKEERQEMARELATLSFGQRKILVAVASGRNRELTGKDFLKHVNMSGSSVIEALKRLEQGDYLEKKEDGAFYFIDPLIASALKLYFFNE
jgi:uncharacterized protein